MALAGSAGRAMAPNTMAQAVVTSRRFSVRILLPVMNVCMVPCPSDAITSFTFLCLDRVLLLTVGRDLVQSRVERDLVLPGTAVDGVLVAVYRIDEVIALAALDGVLTGVGGGLVAHGPDGVVAATTHEQVAAAVVSQDIVARTAVDLVVTIIIPGGTVVTKQLI